MKPQPPPWDAEALSDLMIHVLIVAAMMAIVLISVNIAEIVQWLLELAGGLR